MSETERLGADPAAVPVQLENGEVTLPRSVEEKFIAEKRKYAESVREAYDDLTVAIDNFPSKSVLAYDTNILLLCAKGIQVLLKGNMPVEINDISEMEVDTDGKNDKKES